MQWISLSGYMGKCIYLISSCTVVPPAGLLICSRLFHFFKIKVIYCTSLGSFFPARARLFCREFSVLRRWRLAILAVSGRRAGAFPRCPQSVPAARRSSWSGFSELLWWGIGHASSWFAVGGGRRPRVVPCPAAAAAVPSGCPRAGLGCPCDTKRVIPDPRAVPLCRIPCALLLCSVHTPHSEWLIVAEVFPSSVVLCCQQLELCKDQKADLAVCNAIASGISSAGIYTKSSASHAEPLFGLSLSSIVAVSWISFFINGRVQST